MSKESVLLNVNIKDEEDRKNGKHFKMQHRFLLLKAKKCLLKKTLFTVTTLSFLNQYLTKAKNVWLSHIQFTNSFTLKRS